MVSDWMKDPDALMIAFRNKDVDDLNQRTRQFLKQYGRIETKGYAFDTIKGVKEFCEKGVGLKLITIILPLLSFILSSCAMDYVQGTKVSQDQIATFKIGKTTKAQVISTIGGPQEYKKEGGKEILTYRYQKITPFGNEGYNTIFIFNHSILEEIMKSGLSPSSNPLSQKN